MKTRATLLRHVAMIIWCGIALSSSACRGGWKIEQLAPAQVIAKQPERVRVHLSDRSSLELSRPTIVGDTLFGMQPGGVRRALPLATVTRVDTPRDNSIPIVAGVIVGLGLIVLIVNGGQAF